MLHNKILFKDTPILSNLSNTQLRHRSAVTSPLGLAGWQLPAPPPHCAMSREHNLALDLARDGQSFKQIKATLENVYPDSALKKTAIYDILKKVKEGKNAEDLRQFNGQRTVRTDNLIAAVSAAIEEDRRVTINEIAQDLGVSYGTVYNIIHDDLGLEKLSARWVPKLLSQEQKQARVESSMAFVKMVERKGLEVLNKIVTMDESSVSFHTPATKKQSKEWTKKGQPGPIKAKVHASRTSQMVLAFFDNQGPIYTNYVPRGTTVNANYIVGALGNFMKYFKKKRPEMAAGEWFFHWDNAPVHTAAVVKEWIAAHGVKMIAHPPYSPDLAPADFFLFPRVKEQLAGITMTQETFRPGWERVLRTISAAEFATAFLRWYERSEKCIQIGGTYVEKC